MRPARTAAASVVAAVVVAGLTGAGTAGDAVADLGLPTPTLSPLPTVSLPLPLPTTTTSPLPLPSTSLPSSGSLPGGSGTSGSGTSKSGTSGSGTSGSGSSAGAPTGTTAGSAGSGSTAAPADGATTTMKGESRREAERRKKAATPMVAGTPGARDVVDDESSPAFYRASQAFLAADQEIAAIGRAKEQLARLRQDAKDTAQLYRAIGYDVAGARRTAAEWHNRLAHLDATTSPRERRRVEDTATRADERVGDLVVWQADVKTDFENIADRYRITKRALHDADARLAALAATRSSALSALRAARGSDVALTQARLAESGRLGAEIEALSQQLARRGETVEGTGHLARPLDGTITSPFGMRYHPILHYTKLHTGTDFAGGSVIRAADDGRVIMTVFSEAYGFFTVIDHGVVDGARLTTAYAHQSRFLVHEGEVVHRGEPIGIVGATGYATGPHLHFEVRRNGEVVDPMTLLAR